MSEDAGPVVPKADSPRRKKTEPRVIVICLSEEEMPLPFISSRREHCLECGQPVWVDAKIECSGCICTGCAVSAGIQPRDKMHPQVRRRFLSMGFSEEECDRMQERARERFGLPWRVCPGHEKRVIH